ncbi:WYL domain-containing protein [Puia sp. P3]|uniref:WYL domain-containing protein n=1 Tax=Puia sp. P3 TaxID=3423952 RepID=UPI003D67A621
MGDIVVLKSHPYFDQLTNTLISGDPVAISPLMVVAELFESTSGKGSKESEIKISKYRCIWFSPKIYRIVEAVLQEDDLKLVKKNDVNIQKSFLRRGQLVVLRSAFLELKKKKISFSVDDGAQAARNGSVINALLSFLSPVMQVLNVKPHKSKHSVIEKGTGRVIRQVSAWDVKCALYNPNDEKITELEVPLEALMMMDEVDINLMKTLEEYVANGSYVKILGSNETTIVKPKNLVFKEGHYYLRAYNLLYNNISEFEISSINQFTHIERPFKTMVPSF